jgi:CHAT domain
MEPSSPFVKFFLLPGRSQPQALLGFTLPVLPASAMTNEDLQMRLVSALWGSGVTGLDLRFLKIADSDISISLLLRVACPSQQDKSLFLNHCMIIAGRVVQLWRDSGYQLQAITNESTLISVLQPFQVQALADIRRKEQQHLFEDAYTEYEIYATYPWEWESETHLPIFEILKQLSGVCLASIYLEPTNLLDEEQHHLNHAVSRDVRELLRESGDQGEAIYSLYQSLRQRLQRPYLLRITLAAPMQQTVLYTGQSLLNRLHAIGTMPVLQFPQHAYEWQVGRDNLSYLEARPWGNMRDTLGTARLRYLVDSKGATMGFHLPVAPEPVTSRTQKINVLLVFADPYLMDKPLRLGTEDRIIHEAVQLSRYRDNISITVRHAATIHDLSRALLNDEFHIVHIAGHGIREGLILENEQGEPYQVPPQALADLFEAYKSTLRCVVLNACYSLAQGERISFGITFAVGMEGQLSDQAAREFSRGFYDALGAGKEIDFAYEEGSRRVKLAASGTLFVAKLFRKV